MQPIPPQPAAGMGKHHGTIAVTKGQGGPRRDWAEMYQDSNGKQL
jgi:hypothetical protein